MSDTFECPNCGAAIDYDPGDDPVIPCPFCGTSVVVPQDLRSEPPAQQHISIDVSDALQGSAASSSASPGRSCLLIAILSIVLAIAGGILVILFAGPSVDSLSGIIEEAASPIPSQFTDAVAAYDLQFGAEGTGPGYFTDARSIAVDGEHRIYVGEYDTGRIQVFDESGEFLTQWTAQSPSTPYLRGMDVNRDGVLYIAMGGVVTRYDGMTGDALGTLNYAERGFDDVTIGPDGSVVTAWYGPPDGIIRFNASGDLTLELLEAISGISGGSELNHRVAVDGLGTIYALGTFSNAVFIYDQNGAYQSRFGEEGEESGQFRAPGAITVDNQGNVYVADFWGVQVFSSSGRYLETIESDGYPYGIRIDDQNRLYIVNGTQVTRYNLAP